MESNRYKDFINRVWQDQNPYINFPTGLYPDNRSELGHGTNPFLIEVLEKVRPSLVVEVGVWKGASAIGLAKKMRALGIDDGVVIAIDTWLGSSEHWGRDNPWNKSLNIEFGQPMLMRTFMNNVILSGVSDIVVPLPLDSINANEVFRQNGVGPIDLIHIDAGHDYRSVMSDLEMWWPLVRSGGWLIGDDYVHTGEWPEVRQAFDEFFGKLGLAPFEFGLNKCRIMKP
jgi:hypothetical protein